MCGFAALFEPQRHFAPDLLAVMDADLRHRGPDSSGQLTANGLALIFRRLAILDPGSRSDQPMSDESGRYALVYNGEIYNYRELRAALAAEGVAFRTEGDTEVVLRGFMRWGRGLLPRLEGMYAFVLVDRTAGRAYAARDPYGIKPLYLLQRGRLIGLASEMRPLRRLHDPSVDVEALAELLTFGWAAGSRSNLQGIERVPGGTLLTVNLADGNLGRERFLDVLDTVHPDPDGALPEWAEQAGEALGCSIRAHLASDVGYALQLSGGVDSSLVSAMVKTLTPEELHSFAIHLGGYQHDERPYRDMVIGRYPLSHHEIPLDGKAFADALPRAVRHMEGPVPHGGCVLLMLVCDQVRRVTKVVLTGEGADEFFGGYERYARWRKLWLQEALGGVLPRWLLPPVRPFHGVRRTAGLDAAVHAGVYRDFRPMAALFPGLTTDGGARVDASRRFSDFRDRLTAVDQTAYLESLLVRQDKMSMAASVEARVPFVHLPLARLVNRMPRAVRVPGSETKPVLKRIASRYLPDALIHRRKVGLLLPYDQWLSEPEALGRYLECLTGADARLAQYASAARLRTVVDRFRAGHRRGLPSVWRLVNVEMWLRSLGETGEQSVVKAAA